MESYRILHYIHAPCLLAEDHFTFSLKFIISFLVHLQHLLLPYLIVTSSQVRVDMPLPLQLCCISGLGPESLLQNLSQYTWSSPKIENHFVALILSLIICKQRVISSMPLLLTGEAPLLVFHSLLRFLLRTLPSVMESLPVMFTLWHFVSPWCVFLPCVVFCCWSLILTSCWLSLSNILCFSQISCWY